jgi:hypothetical protein
MKITVETIYKFDLEKEFDRINQYFEGQVKARQLRLLELFKDGNFNKWIELYNELPYNDQGMMILFKLQE